MVIDFYASSLTKDGNKYMYTGYPLDDEVAQQGTHGTTHGVAWLAKQLS